MNVTQQFLEWLEGYANLSGYVPSRGMWVESEANATKRFLSIFMAGGRSPDTDFVRYPQIRLLVVGRRNERQYSGGILEVENFASGIIEHAIEEFQSGCIVQIRPMAEMIGPMYTEHDRCAYEINFELII